jgi:hypothetical protein
MFTREMMSAAQVLLHQLPEHEAEQQGLGLSGPNEADEARP